MKNTARLLLIGLFLAAGLLLAPLLVDATAAAQGDSCPEIVDRALQTTEDLCATTGRDQVCYGNWLVSAQAKPGVLDLAFNYPGDTANLVDVATLQLAHLEQVPDIWGVSLIRSQLDLPGTLPGQSMNILLFGTGAEFQANEDMSAFTFLAGLGAPTCAPVPTGLLLQSPAGTEVALNINGVDVLIGSTVFVTSTPEQTTIGLLEGQAWLLSGGVYHPLPETMLVDVPRNPDGSPGVPGQPYPMPLALQQQLQGPFDLLNRVAAEEGQTAGPVEDKPTGAVVTQPGGACTVSTMWDNVTIHVGPGDNRGVAGMMQPGFEYKAIGFNDQNGEWLRLDLNQIHFRTGASELWVNMPRVDTTGDCTALGFAAAPPVVVAPQPAPPPVVVVPDPVTPVDPIVPPPPGGESSILYGADRYQLAAGECVNLFWNVQNVQAVYFEGQGVAGESNWVVCPMLTTTYTLRVVKADGQTEERSLTITVTTGPITGDPMISFWADEFEIERYSCTTLRWSTANVESVYYNSQGVPGNGSDEVCPGGDSTYHLRVNKIGGGYEDRYLTIYVFDPSP